MKPSLIFVLSCLLSCTPAELQTARDVLSITTQDCTALALEHGDTEVAQACAVAHDVTPVLSLLLARRTLPVSSSSVAIPVSQPKLYIK